MIEIIGEGLNILVHSEIVGRIVRTIGVIFWSGAGLGLVLFLGTAIVRDLIQDIKGGQWKP